MLPVKVREELWHIMGLIGATDVSLHEIQEDDTYQYLSQHCENRQIAVPKKVVLNDEIESYIKRCSICDVDIQVIDGEECVVFVDLSSLFHQLTSMYDKVLSIVNFEHFVQWRYNLCRSSIYRMNIVIDQMEVLQHLHTVRI